ncbi:MAG: hypothetical protein IJZ04_05415 [Clostridia bacterium]|nr:hypothetical protein [Clostridia bacterium]
MRVEDISSIQKRQGITMNNCLCGLFDNEVLWLIIIAIIVLNCCCGGCGR